MEVEQRMGEPAAVARGVEHRGWVRRHPLLVFGLAPVPALVLTGACYVLVLAGLGYAFGPAEGAPPEGMVRSTIEALLYGIAIVPFLGAALGLGWLSVWSGAARWWAVVALAQVVILAGLVTVGCTWSDLPGQSTLTVGVGFPLTGWRQAAQMLLPLILGWLMLRGRGPTPCAVA